MEYPASDSHGKHVLPQVNCPATEERCLPEKQEKHEVLSSVQQHSIRKPGRHPSPTKVLTRFDSLHQLEDQNLAAASLHLELNKRKKEQQNAAQHIIKKLAQ